MGEIKMSDTEEDLYYRHNQQMRDIEEEIEEYERQKREFEDAVSEFASCCADEQECMGECVRILTDAGECRKIEADYEKFCRDSENELHRWEEKLQEEKLNIQKRQKKVEEEYTLAIQNPGYRKGDD